MINEIVMTNLEMMTQREQLMEDIDSIIECYLYDVDIDDADRVNLVAVLCDAVCKNSPAKWLIGIIIVF